jgi:hypothetical protein
MIGKTKKENAGQTTGGRKKKTDLQIGKKTAADKPIGGRTLIRVARPPK